MASSSVFRFPCGRHVRCITIRGKSDFCSGCLKLVHGRIYRCDAPCGVHFGCESCVVDKKSSLTIGPHLHPLFATKSSYDWRCDVCRYVPAEGVGPRGRYRCIECDFDVCFMCAQRLQKRPDDTSRDGAGESLDVHRESGHLFYPPRYSTEAWCCTFCSTLADPRRDLRWRCSSCDYSLCESCHSQASRHKSASSSSTLPVAAHRTSSAYGLSMAAGAEFKQNLVQALIEQATRPIGRMIEATQPPTPHMAMARGNDIWDWEPMSSVPGTYTATSTSSSPVTRCSVPEPEPQPSAPPVPEPEPIEVDTSSEEPANDDEDDQTCVACLDNKRKFVFIGCGHLVYCRDCALRACKVDPRTTKRTAHERHKGTCPMCRGQSECISLIS